MTARYFSIFISELQYSLNRYSGMQNRDIKITLVRFLFLSLSFSLLSSIFQSFEVPDVFYSLKVRRFFKKCIPEPARQLYLNYRFLDLWFCLFSEIKEQFSSLIFRKIANNSDLQSSQLWKSQFMRIKNLRFFLDFLIYCL